MVMTYEEALKIAIPGNDIIPKPKRPYVKRVIKIVDGVNCYSCNKCGEIKPETDFQKDSKNKHGVQWQCKECFRKRHKSSEYRRKNAQRQKGKLSTDPIARRKANARVSAWLRKQSEQLTDYYIRNLIHESTGVPRNKIPKSLIDCHREKIKINRLIKQLSDEQNKQHQRPSE